MKKEKIAIISMVLSLIIFLSFYFDKEIVKGISLLQNSYLTDFFLGITFVSSELIIFFFLTSLFLIKMHHRKWILPLWFTLFMSAIVSFLLKVFIQRLRPFQQGIVSVLSILQKPSHDVWNYSFPSFQAMLAFCTIPILAKEFPKFKYLWIVFASLVAFSRVYFGVHFASDVIVGCLIGYLIGVVIVSAEEEKCIFGKIRRKVFEK